MRSSDFAEAIVSSFAKTKNIVRTAEDLDLDISLVRYWLKQSGIDIRGQAAYQRPQASQASVILGSTITMYRLQNGLGHPADLANVAGMSTKKITTIERGEKDILFSELVRISNALNVPIALLVEKL